MTPEKIAALADVAWPGSGWSLDEIRKTLESPSTHLITCGAYGFLMAQVVRPDADILIIAVDPAHRRQGHAHAMLRDLKARANRIFLEVRADNGPALALYQAAGFAETGRRTGYYTTSGGRHVDAVTMSWAAAASGSI